MFFQIDQVRLKVTAQLPEKAPADYPGRRRDLALLFPS
jgi:hypothetical protein